MRTEKLTFVKRRSGYYFKEPERGIERLFRPESLWEPTPQKVRLWLSMCKSRDATTRHEGLFALRRSGAMTPRLVELASDALRAEARARADRGGERRRVPVRRSGLLAALTAALDPDDDLSGSEIVRTVRELGDRSAVDPLRTLLERIVRRTGPVDATAARRPLAELDGDRAHYALTVIDALLALGAQRERVMLLEFLDHQEDVIRSLALSILHDRAGPWSRPALRKVLDGDGPFFRRMVAAEALLPMGDARAQRFLVEAARSPQVEERRRAIPALALRHAPEDLALLLSIWRREDDPDERLDLGIVLLERGLLTHRQVFWECLSHPYPHRRLRAARLLAAASSEEARTTLAKALADEPDAFIRSEVARVSSSVAASARAEESPLHARARA